MSRIMVVVVFVLSMTVFIPLSVHANNLQVTNTTVVESFPPDGSASVQFDVSWDNSWRIDGPEEGDGWFHDAAWIFFKVQAQGFGEWQHVVMDSAGTNPPGFSTGTAGDLIEMVVPDDRVGLFVRRSAEGTGSLTSSNVTVRWNLADSGVSSSQAVKLLTFGVEMVYVANGPFWVGDGSVGFAKTWINTNDPTVAASGDAPRSGGRPTTGAWDGSDDWPNGYNAFYCMKYSITQGQYADFLNTLADHQVDARYSGAAGNRYTLSGTWPSIIAVASDRACNFLSWADGAAFADWSGLRPMTELEYEKACRGILDPTPNEFAWGDTDITLQEEHADGTDGTGEDVAIPAGANCNLGNIISGPVRVGLYAADTTSRRDAGASYWGIMEMSGNVWERPVTLARDTGRAFSGLHGNGTLDIDGNPDVALWPGLNGDGAGFRGGSWGNTTDWGRVSDRNFASHTGNSTYHINLRHSGFRAVRTAP